MKLNGGPERLRVAGEVSVAKSLLLAILLEAEGLMLIVGSLILSLGTEVDHRWLSLFVVVDIVVAGMQVIKIVHRVMH